MQKSVSGAFSKWGYRAGWLPTISEETYMAIAGESPTEVAAKIRAATEAGNLSSEYYYTNLEVGLYDLEGQTLIYNTRTSEALRLAGIPREDWITVDVTDYINEHFGRGYVLQRLAENGLGPEGSATLRVGPGSVVTTQESVNGGSDPVVRPGGGAPDEEEPVIEPVVE